MRSHPRFIASARWPHKPSPCAVCTSTAPRHGFALIIALSMLAFLTLLTLSLATLTGVDIRTAEDGRTQREAQQNALMALNIALASLQELAGPDQRITATASILNASNNTIPESHRQWTGVWSTENYNPQAARTKTSHFSGWLVSSPQANHSYTDDADAPKDDTLSAVTIRTGADEEHTVRVPLVLLEENSGNSYAYWVEDLGVKADASVSGATIPEDTSREDLLTALAAAPALHAGILAGNTASGPWSTDSASVALRTKLGNAISRDHVGVATSSPNFENENWPHFATGVYGLATDARNGGLKQDLSLAFEMDGTTTTPNNLARFNKSAFAGNGNRNEIPTTALESGPGQDFIARHLYIEPFTFDGEARLARGPTWHLLRNHYNLYKELTNGATSPRLAARGIGPNAALWNANQNYSDFIFARLQTGRETNSQGRYVTLPTSGAYAPLLLKTSFILSLQLYDYDADTDSGKIAVVLDPVLFIWNPYNVSIEFDVLKVAYPGESAGDMFKLVLKADDGAGNIVATDDGNEGFFNRLVRMNDPTSASGYDSMVIHYLSSGVGTTVMAPGEVMVFSSITPSVYESVSMRQKLTPGVQFSPNGGTRLTVFNIGGSNQEFVATNVGDTTFTLSAELPGGKRFRTSIMLADSANMIDQSGSTLRIKRSLSDQDIQFQAVNGSSSANPDGTALTISTDIYGSGELIPLAQDGGKKMPALIIENSLKSANPDSGTAVAILGDFNPFAHMGTETLQWRVNSPNRHLIFRNFNSYESLGETSGSNAYWGKSYRSTGSTQVIGAGIPQQPLLSIAALRHAPTALSTFEVPQAIGNSFAHVQISRDAAVGPNAYQGKAWDSAWLMNNALFDSYFFSGLTPDYELRSSGYTVTSTLDQVIDRWTTGGALRNPRHKLLPTRTPATVAAALKADDGYRKTAAHTLVQGSFNVNSTSAPAWAALLCGLLDIPMPQYGQNSNNTASGLPVSKAVPASGSVNDMWRGFRRLTSEAIYNPANNTGLAVAIADEVKRRGPFMGLSDFVNRRLADDETGSMGALQAAIEARNLNTTARAEGTAPDYNEFSNPQGGSGSTASGISGYIMQADLLEPLAPFLSARSDTFAIRAYGQVADPANANKVLSRALCEVIVQRLPEYVDSEANTAYDLPAELSELNRKFGRRFQIVSFQWITP